MPVEVDFNPLAPIPFTMIFAISQEEFPIQQ